MLLLLRLLLFWLTHNLTRVWRVDLPPKYSPGCQLSAGTSDFVTIWDLLVISASASADPYIFRVFSYQCPAQCLLL